MHTRSRKFQSLGPSAFVSATRNALRKVLDSDRWSAGKGDSLRARFNPATCVLESLGGPGLIAQLWMERPWDGKGACKLELFGDVRSLDDRLGKEKRKEIAGLIRRFLVVTVKH